MVFLQGGFGVLPEGFALPPLPYLLALVVGVALVAAGFRRRPPAVTDRHVLALVPWMAVGAAAHVLYVVDALPAALRPLAGTPSVYVTVAVVAGGLWLALDGSDVAVPRALGGLGLLALLPVVAGALLTGLARGSLSVVWPGVGLLVSVVVGVAAWWTLGRLAPGVAVTGVVGLLAVFGHTLDAVSTAVGIDVLGFGERTPLSRVIIEFAGTLPTAELLGVGWLFVLVKLAVAGFVVSLLADYVREEPTEGYLLLGLVAAVGLGPGVHNLLLFAIA